MPRVGIGLLVTLAVIVPGAVRGQAPAAVSRLGWMAGCWELSAGKLLIEEQWTRPRAGLMLGSSRTVVDGALREYEQVALLERDGRVIYAARPVRQAPAEFAGTTVSDSAAVFENPAHDFPQRIIYRRLGADSLVARVEGTRDGRSDGSDFPYRRVSCP